MSAATNSLRALMFGVIGSAAVIGWASVSRAEQAPIVQSVRVYTGDLHLDRPADTAILYGRIRLAAEASCGEPQLPESHFIDPDYRQCVQVAIRAAVAQVDSPALSAYYQRHRSRERRS